MICYAIFHNDTLVDVSATRSTAYYYVLQKNKELNEQYGDSPLGRQKAGRYSFKEYLSAEELYTEVWKRLCLCRFAESKAKVYLNREIARSTKKQAKKPLPEPSA